MFCALVFVVMFRAHVQLRILTPLLDWKRCSSSQSSPFSDIRTIRSNISAGCGCSLQLVILFDTFFISFEISSEISCLLSAVSQFILFTQIQICLFLGRLNNFECCRVCLFGHHCDLRDGIHAVLRVSGGVSIFNWLQSDKHPRNWSIPAKAAVFPHETSVICSGYASSLTLFAESC